MEDLSIMRTMLLLSATRRKLNLEEPIMDSSSPLKALQLSQVAVRLNNRLHAEETMQGRAPSMNGLRAFRSPLYESMIAESDEEEEEGTEEGAWNDGLAQMNTAIEVGTAQHQTHDEVIELLDIEEEEEKLSSRDAMRFGAVEYDMDFEDFEEEDDDMPMLSRQTSHSYTDSASSLSEDEDNSSEEDTVDETPSHQEAEEETELGNSKEEVERCKQAFYKSCKASIFHLSAHGEQQYRPAVLHATPPMAAAVA